MKARTRFFVVWLLFLAFAFRGFAKPNFVFILMDDLGWTDLSCYGSKFFQSPNIDKLAAQGMKFTDAYAACPVCSPTRASILTGKYPARLKLTDYLPGRKNRPDQKLLQAAKIDHLPAGETTLPKVLKQAGYISGAFGKWHLGGKNFGPTTQGFDVAPPDDAKSGLPGSNEPGKGDYQITEHAIQFIRENRDKPFFAYVAYHTPHIPLAAPKNLVTEYEAKIDPRLPQTNATYAAMIEVADAQIARLLSTLDDLELSENTVVFFTSDNGGLHVREWKREVKATQNTPLRAGKGYLYEGGIRIPLIVRWPGVVKPGTVCNSVMSSVDYFPTILEISGANNPETNPIDGQSLVSLLQGKIPGKPRELFWHYPHYPNQGSSPAGAIRVGDFKFIEFYGNGRWELYNLRSDLSESNDLANILPAKAAELANKLDLWRRNVGAVMPLPNPDWNPQLKRDVPTE